jgi:hypothetical protein
LYMVRGNGASRCVLESDFLTGNLTARSKVASHTPSHSRDEDDLIEKRKVRYPLYKS